MAPQLFLEIVKRGFYSDVWLNTLPKFRVSSLLIRRLLPELKTLDPIDRIEMIAGRVDIFRFGKWRERFLIVSSSRE
jgi:hypothetical protein